MAPSKRIQVATRNGMVGFAVFQLDAQGQETQLDWLSTFELVLQRYPDASFGKRVVPERNDPVGTQ